MLAAASQVCRVWYATCAPELYRKLFVRSAQCLELIEDLSRPGNRIVQHAEELVVQGPVPWCSVSRLLKLLPLVTNLSFYGDELATNPRAVYHHTAPRLSSAMSVASSLTSELSSLFLENQWFSSAVDVLYLLGLCRGLVLVEIRGCIIHSGSRTAPLVSATSLKDLTIWRGKHAVHEKAIAPLARWWQWPRAAANSTAAPYPGIDRAASLDIVGILGTIQFDSLMWSR